MGPTRFQTAPQSILNRIGSGCDWFCPQLFLAKMLDVILFHYATMDCSFRAACPKTNWAISAFLGGYRCEQPNNFVSARGNPHVILHVREGFLRRRRC
jgi:hypothetical protein